MAWYNPIDWFQSGDYDSSSTGNTVQPGGRNAPGYDVNTLDNVLARNIFIDREEENLYAELERRNQAALDRQRAADLITQAQYEQNSRLNQSLGNTYDDTLGKRGVASFARAIPWWIWLIAAGAIAFYLGAFKNILSKVR